MNKCAKRRKSAKTDKIAAYALLEAARNIIGCAVKGYWHAEFMGSQYVRRRRLRWGIYSAGDCDQQQQQPQQQQKLHKKTTKEQSIVEGIYNESIDDATGDNSANLRVALLLLWLFVSASAICGRCVLMPPACLPAHRACLGRVLVPSSRMQKDKLECKRGAYHRIVLRI